MNERKCETAGRIVCIHAAAGDLGKTYMLNETDCVCTDCLDRCMEYNDPSTLEAVCTDCFTEIVAAVADCVE